MKLTPHKTMYFYKPNGKAPHIITARTFNIIAKREYTPDEIRKNLDKARNLIGDETVQMPTQRGILHIARKR